MRAILAGQLRDAQVTDAYATVYGSEGWGSNPSERARSQASPVPGEAFLLTDLLTAAINQIPPRGRK
jgi:hypothetical protein